MHIIPRDYHFDFSDLANTYKCSTSYQVHLFNSPSMCLPYIEGLINHSVRLSLNQITDDELYRNCLQFIKQETHHAREHVNYNKQLHHLGYEADDVVSKIKNKLLRIKNHWSLLSILAVGLSFECLAAAISQTTLENHLLDNVNITMKQFWEWHMTEELEHRSVLFDLYQHVGGGYIRRVAIHTLILIFSSYYLCRIYLRFIKKDRGSIYKGLLSIINSKSLFVRSLLKSLNCYRLKYHPDQTPR